MRTGSERVRVPGFTVPDAPMQAIDLGDGASGHHSILFHRDDQRRRAGSFKESGVIHEVVPFDEFIYVAAGSTTSSVKEGETFTLDIGDCSCLGTGQVGAFGHSPSLQDNVEFASDNPSEF